MKKLICKLWKVVFKCTFMAKKMYILSYTKGWKTLFFPKPTSWTWNFVFNAPNPIDNVRCFLVVSDQTKTKHVLITWVWLFAMYNGIAKISAILRSFSISKSYFEYPKIIFSLHFSATALLLSKIRATISILPVLQVW